MSILKLISIALKLLAHRSTPRKSPIIALPPTKVFLYSGRTCRNSTLHSFNPTTPIKPDMPHMANPRICLPFSAIKIAILSGACSAALTKFSTRPQLNSYEEKRDSPKKFSIIVRLSLISFNELNLRIIILLDSISDTSLLCYLLDVVFTANNKIQLFGDHNFTNAQFLF